MVINRPCGNRKGRRFCSMYETSVDDKRDGKPLQTLMERAGPMRLNTSGLSAGKSSEVTSLPISNRTHSRLPFEALFKAMYWSRLHRYPRSGLSARAVTNLHRKSDPLIVGHSNTSPISMIHLRHPLSWRPLSMYHGDQMCTRCRETLERLELKSNCGR